MVQAIQTIVSRRKSALEPVVITVGGIKSTTFRPNIVAEEVEIIGTCRYFQPEMVKFLDDELRRCCQLAEAMGGSYEFKYFEDNPILHNDHGVTESVRAAGTRLLGPKAVLESPLEMGAEDFSFVSAAVPSCFIVLGAAVAGRPALVAHLNFRHRRISHSSRASHTC